LILLTSMKHYLLYYCLNFAYILLHLDKNLISRLLNNSFRSKQIQNIRGHNFAKRIVLNPFRILKYEKKTTTYSQFLFLFFN
jgi:hypothetical protein